MPLAANRDNPLRQNHHRVHFRARTWSTTVSATPGTVFPARSAGNAPLPPGPMARWGERGQPLDTELCIVFVAMEAPCRRPFTCDATRAKWLIARRQAERAKAHSAPTTLVVGAVRRQQTHRRTGRNGMGRHTGATNRLGRPSSARRGRRGGSGPGRVSSPLFYAERIVVCAPKRLRTSSERRKERTRQYWARKEKLKLF